MLIKALMASHDILLEDLRRISTGIDQAIDLTEIAFESDDTKWFDSTPPARVQSIDGEQSPQLPDREEVSVVLLFFQCQGCHYLFLLCVLCYLLI
jgi:hypothetical protein